MSLHSGMFVDRYMVIPYQATRDPGAMRRRGRTAWLRRGVGGVQQGSAYRFQWDLNLLQTVVFPHQSSILKL